MTFVKKEKVETPAPQAPAVETVVAEQKPQEPETPIAVVAIAEQKAQEPEAPKYAGPKIPDKLKGDTIVVNKAGFAKLYGALMKNKPGFYLGASTKRICRDVLGAKDDLEVAAMHEYIRHIC